MGSHKQREERRKTFLRARMRTEHGWCDVTIGNVSSRGLMLQCASPPDRNSVVEVRHGPVIVIGRIAWSHGAKCGLRTQDRVDMAALLSHMPPPARKPGVERRLAPRDTKPARSRAPAETAEASRRFARMFDWAMILLGTGAAAAFMAQSAAAAFGEPITQVTKVLANTN